MATWKDLLGTLQTAFRVGKSSLSASGLTALRTHTLPNASGVLSLTAPFGAVSLTNNTVATTETIIAKWAVAANFPAALDNYVLDLNGQVSGAATLTFRIRFGTAGTIADPLLCTFTVSAAGVANAYHYLEAMISFLSGTTATATGTSTLGSGVVGVATAAFAAATVNLTVANFLSVTLVQSAAQTYTIRAAQFSA